jgi:AcrR family transcriptional regulator
MGSKDVRKKGYTATSVRKIVEEAGVSKPSLYYYFGNKEELDLLPENRSSF